MVLVVLEEVKITIEDIGDTKKESFELDTSPTEVLERMIFSHHDDEDLDNVSKTENGLMKTISNDIKEKSYGTFENNDIIDKINPKSPCNIKNKMIFMLFFGSSIAFLVSLYLLNSNVAIEFKLPFFIAIIVTCITMIVIILMQ